MSNLTKYCVRLRPEDVDTIAQHYPDFGYNKIIRHLVAKLAEKIRAERKDAIDKAVKEFDYMGDVE